MVGSLNEKYAASVESWKAGQIMRAYCFDLEDSGQPCRSPRDCASDRSGDAEVLREPVGVRDLSYPSRAGSESE